MGKVIKHMVWVSPEGGTYSVFTSWKPPGSKLVQMGWTILWPDGTTGTGRVPFETEDDAIAFVNSRPNFKGMHALGS
jgi:hypothetical protein